VGFDDLPDARHFLPPLTTVRQDFAALGKLALSAIISAIDGEDIDQCEMIAAKLKIRASTAAVTS
jgi:DNA-binding LacI/PurR family transcriptional regulator